LYGINHFQRYIDTNNNHFEFLYPDNWFIDQNVLLTREIIREKPLQLQGIKTSQSFAKSPDIAFKDVNSKGKKNLSVLRTTVIPGFSISGTLGSPNEAAPKLLALIAPSSSGKIANLLNVYNAKYDRDLGFLTKMTSSSSSSVTNVLSLEVSNNNKDTMAIVDDSSSSSFDSDRNSGISTIKSPSSLNEPDAIVLEYRIEKEGTSLNQHCLAVISYEDATNSLYTLTAMVPETDWLNEGDRVRTIALSFHLNK